MRKNIGKNGQFGKPTQQNPHNVASSKKRRPLPKYLIADQIRELLRVIRPPRDQAIFRLAYHHGLRASEIGMIQMSDYRPGRRAENDYLLIERLKGSIGGDTKLIPAAAHAIRMWLKTRGWASGPLFPSKKKNPISRSWLHRLMQRYCAMAGIPPEKAHFHTLKHTCGTMLLSERKESIVDVQHHLGHADIKSTMIYATLTEQADEERSQRLKDWK